MSEVAALVPKLRLCMLPDMDEESIEEYPVPNLEDTLHLDLPELAEIHQISHKSGYEKICAIQSVFRDYLNNVLNERVEFKNYMQKSISIFEQIPFDIAGTKKLEKGIRPFTTKYGRNQLRTSYRENLKKETSPEKCPHKTAKNQRSISGNDLTQRQETARADYQNYLLKISSIFTESKNLFDLLIEDTSTKGKVSLSVLKETVKKSNTIIALTKAAMQVLYR